MFLLDTNVVSEIARAQRGTVNDHVASWLEEKSEELWLSVVTAAEIEDGIAKALRTGATRRAGSLREWWDAVLHYYAGRILPLDLRVARETGRLMDVARSAGISPGFEDIAIAATAHCYGLCVLTRNTRDFMPLGVEVRNPFEDVNT